VHPLLLAGRMFRLTKHHVDASLRTTDRLGNVQRFESFDDSLDIAVSHRVEHFDSGVLASNFEAQSGLSYEQALR
jgi:hypothetical protein